MLFRHILTTLCSLTTDGRRLQVLRDRAVRPLLPSQHDPGRRQPPPYLTAPLLLREDDCLALLRVLRLPDREGVRRRDDAQGRRHRARCRRVGAPLCYQHSKGWEGGPRERVETTVHSYSFWRGGICRVGACACGPEAQ